MLNLAEKTDIDALKVTITNLEKRIISLENEVCTLKLNSRNNPWPTPVYGPVLDYDPYKVTCNLNKFSSMPGV